MTQLQVRNERLLDIFKTKSISIPDFQRDYSWGEDEVGEFLADALTSYHDKDKEYFFGSMVFIEDGEKLRIIDGQQRIITMLLSIIVIRDILHQNNEVVNASKLTAYTIDEENTPAFPRIQLNKINNKFNDYLVSVSNNFLYF